MRRMIQALSDFVGAQLWAIYYDDTRPCPPRALEDEARPTWWTVANFAAIGIVVGLALATCIAQCAHAINR